MRLRACSAACPARALSAAEQDRDHLCILARDLVACGEDPWRWRCDPPSIRPQPFPTPSGCVSAALSWLRTLPRLGAAQKKEKGRPHGRPAPAHADENQGVTRESIVRATVATGVAAPSVAARGTRRVAVATEFRFESARVGLRRGSIRRHVVVNRRRPHSAPGTTGLQ